MKTTAVAILGCALLELFSRCKLHSGRATRGGFAYTFELDSPFDETTLGLVERQMAAIICDRRPILPKEMHRASALGFFRHLGQEMREEMIEASPHQLLPLLQMGEYWDILPPPYLSSSSELRAYRLLGFERLREGEGRREVYRIFGVVAASQGALKTLLKGAKDALRYDHRRLGRELGLFSVSVKGEGVTWTPRGTAIHESLYAFWRKAIARSGYSSVETPLFVASDRLEDFGIDSPEDLGLVPRPSLAPLHAELFAARAPSYRELPITFAEWGVAAPPPQDEDWGIFALPFQTLDQLTLFCGAAELEEALISSLQFIEEAIKLFKFDQRVRVSCRHRGSFGTRLEWERGLSSLVGALKACSIPFTFEEQGDDEAGDEVFGPSIKWEITDSLGRPWRGPHLGIDLKQPARLSLRYQGRDGDHHPSQMVVFSLFGSRERWMALLLESTKGELPLWIAPEQVRLLPLAERHLEAARGLQERLSAEGLRASVEQREETMGNRIRLAQIEKVPYTVVMGDREVEEGSVAVRSLGQGLEQGFEQDKVCRYGVEEWLASLRRELGSTIE